MDAYFRPRFEQIYRVFHFEIELFNYDPLKATIVGWNLRSCIESKDTWSTIILIISAQTNGRIYDD